MNPNQVSRRQFLQGAALAGVTISIPGVLAACAPSAGTGASAASSTAVTPRTLDFWWNPSVESAEAMVKWMKGRTDAFSAANPGVTVESAQQPVEQLIGNFRTACQAKSGPAVDFQFGPSTMQFVWEGCIAPISGVLDSQFTHVLPKEALNLYKSDGKTWALPWYNAPIPLMYNKAMFRDAGLDPEKPPATVDELITAAAALRAKGYTPFGYGVKNLTGIGNFSGMFNMQQLDDPKQLIPMILGKEKYTDPKFSGWMETVKRMIDAKVFNPDVTSLEYADAMNLFLAKKCAMAITSSLAKFQAALGDDLGVMAPPAWGTGKLAGRVHFNSHPLFITSFAGDKALAAKFIEHLHSTESLNGLYEATGFFPADDRFDATKLKTPQDKVLWKLQAEKSVIGYQNYWPSKMDRENLFLAVQAMFAGQATPAQAAAQVDERLTAWRASAANDLKNFEAWAKQ